MRGPTVEQTRVWLPRAGLTLYLVLVVIKLIRAWPLGQKNPRITAPPSLTADILGVLIWAALVWMIIVACFWLIMLVLNKIGSR